MSKIESVPISLLVEDLEMYPRHNVDSQHVADLASALESGRELPPLVADKKSKKLTDGWHRRRAYIRVYGNSVEVPVELIDYVDDTEMLKDAIARNASHGRKLQRIDQTRSAHMLEQLGVSTVEIAAILGVTGERVTKLMIKVANTRSHEPDNIPGTKKIVLKQSTFHLRDSTLTSKQVQAHRSAPGNSYMFSAKQLIDALDADLIDLTNAKMVERLQQLHAILDKVLGSVS